MDNNTSENATDNQYPVYFKYTKINYKDMLVCGLYTDNNISYKKWIANISITNLWLVTLEHFLLMMKCVE